MKKIRFEKFKIAKLIDLHKVTGGDDGTQTVPPPPPKCKQTSKVWED